MLAAYTKRDAQLSVIRCGSKEHFLFVGMLLCNYAKSLCDAPIFRPKMGPMGPAGKAR